MALNKEQAARLKALEEVEAEESNPQMARLGQEQQRREDEGVDPAQDMQDSQDQLGKLGQSLKEEGGRILDDPGGFALAAGSASISGATMDFDDETGGAFLALKQKYIDGDQRDWGIQYREKRDEIRAKKLEMRESFPTTSFLSESFVGGAFMGAKVVKLFGKSKRAAIASGMAEGAGTGWGMSEADIFKDGQGSKLIFDFGLGAVIGGGVGTVMAGRRALVPTERQSERAALYLRSKELGEVGKSEFMKDFGNPKDIAQEMHYTLNAWSNKDMVLNTDTVKFELVNPAAGVVPNSMVAQLSPGHYLKRNQDAISKAGEARDQILRDVNASETELLISGQNMKASAEEAGYEGISERQALEEGSSSRGESEFYVSPKHFDAKERYLADNQIHPDDIVSTNIHDEGQSLKGFRGEDGELYEGFVTLEDNGTGSRSFIGRVVDDSKFTGKDTSLKLKHRRLVNETNAHRKIQADIEGFEEAFQDSIEGKYIPPEKVAEADSVLSAMKAKEVSIRNNLSSMEKDFLPHLQGRHMKKVKLDLPDMEHDEIQQAIASEMGDMAKGLELLGGTESNTIAKGSVEVYEAFLDRIRGGVHITDLNNIKKEFQANIKDFNGIRSLVDSSAMGKKRVMDILQRKINDILEKRVEKSLGAAEAERFVKLNDAMTNMYHANNYHHMAMHPRGTMSDNMTFTPFVSKIGATVKFAQTFLDNRAIAFNRSRAYWSDMLNHFKGHHDIKLPPDTNTVWDRRESVYIKLALSNPSMAEWFEGKVLNQDESVGKDAISRVFPQMFDDPSMMGEFENAVAFDNIVTDPVKKSMISQQIHKREDLGIIERAELINEFHRTGKIPDVLNPNKG